MAERVRTGDREAAEAGPPHPIALVLDNLRSAHNVGNVFRLAEICRVERIVTCGYTATPPHPKLEKTARGCDRLVPCTHAATGAEAVAALRTAGYRILAVETVQDAPAVWDAEWTWPVAFVFGNEALGIAPETLAVCDGALQLPVFGRKNSLNVGNCAAVVLYEAIRRLLPATKPAAAH